MNIIFSADNNLEIVILPVVPEEVPIDREQFNEEFETMYGTINLIGNLGLRKLSIESLLPSKEYPWMNKGSLAVPMAYISFFEKWRAKKVPIRVVITSDYDEEILNMPVLINNLSYRTIRNGHFRYSLDLSEFVFVKGKVI